MRVLIVGVGRAGLTIAQYLSGSGHEVTVIDRDRAVAERASERSGLVALTGDATDAVILEDAEVARADVVVAMLRRDADNLAVALLAKANGVRRVMVRMRDTAYRAVYLSAGVDRLLSETEVLLGALATAIEHDSVLHAMLLGNGESVAVEIAIPTDSRIAGLSVSEIATDPRFPASCVFAGLYRTDGTVEGPRGSSIVQGGSTVLLVARRDELARTIDFLGGK
ncbi:MAG TPA: TrkA family potassium uptake protein [Polyangiaceae bacterium]|nr:TrkA family potassium uptake protein [Polyangiaceae bacterium]